MFYWQLDKPVNGDTSILNAANPVGAVSAHRTESLLSFHNSFTMALVDEFPVPPTPLMNMHRGLFLIQEYLPFW